MDKSEFIKQFKSRTKGLAVKIVLFYDEMPKTDASRVIGRQLIRSVTSLLQIIEQLVLQDLQKSFTQRCQ